MQQEKMGCLFRELRKEKGMTQEHTYCTNMARAGMNPKSLQYLMGHSEVATTMDVYIHFGYEEAKVEVEKVSGNNL